MSKIVFKIKALANSILLSIKQLMSLVQCFCVLRSISFDKNWFNLFRRDLKFVELYFRNNQCMRITVDCMQTDTYISLVKLIL